MAGARWIAFAVCLFASLAADGPNQWSANLCHALDTTFEHAGPLTERQLEDDDKPVKVFILAGQSNMEGQAVVDLDGKNYNDGKGTLNSLFMDPAKARLCKHLKTDKGEWVVRDDVWVRYQREKGPLLAGPLKMGFSVYGDKHH